MTGRLFPQHVCGAGIIVVWLTSRRAQGTKRRLTLRVNSTTNQHLDECNFNVEQRRRFATAIGARRIFDQQRSTDCPLFHDDEGRR